MVGGDAGSAPSLFPYEGIPYVTIPPVPGTLVVFPSFVPHFVTPINGARDVPDAAADTDADHNAEFENNSAAVRISVAFNFKPAM